MKRLVLFIILAVFAVFVYFASFRQMIIWPLMFAELPLVALYYVFTSVVTEKMVRKTRGNEEFFFIRASRINADATALIPGAITVTPSEIIFYCRKSAAGGVSVSWSCQCSQLREYTMCKVDEHHKGIILSFIDTDDEEKFVSSSIHKREAELRKALGWDS